MFPWNIAKSAEAMFSRWAIKRVCKFLLKKKLGQFILGDIDLDQLDVQLAAGTIQLSDVALNVDYVNQKFGAAAAMIVKEGSIGSLLVTMPWKGKGCQIEIDELELVLTPFGGNNSQFGSETCIPVQDNNNSVNHDLGELKHEMVDNAVTSASVDVHEGVKTIAKMVKWLLSSFHVKVTKVIVAFDPCLGEEKQTEFCKTLVLRITEAECGTCISEDANSNADVTVDNFLGFSRLTNFIKFHGATLEFLQMDSVNNQVLLPSASGAAFDEWFSGCRPSSAMTPIVTGEKGGISGTLKLSIPWKNGSLDIRKVDADAYIDPLVLRIQPCSIKWFLYLFEIFNGLRKNSKDNVHQNSESVYFSAASHCHSSISGSCVVATDKVLPNNESFFADFSSPTGKETVTNAMLPGSHLISDWVPSSHSKNQKDKSEAEPDFGASIHQFFECFDGMRSSQSALGQSGMWNWTCSVFSAITAATSLASGSLHIPSVQQHVETNLKATVAGISVLFSFFDEDQKHCDLNGDQMNIGSEVHYLRSEFQDMFFVLKVCPREINFEVTVEHIELTDHFSNGNAVMNFGMPGCNDDIESRIVSIQQMQAAVQGALPPFSSSAEDADLGKPSGSVGANSFRDRYTSRADSLSIYRDDVVKVMLLRTSGVSQCQFTINSSSSDGSFMGPTSFSLKLPPFVFWVNFHLINMVLDLLKEVGNSFEMISTKKDIPSEAFNGNYNPSYHGDVKSTSSSHQMNLSQKESLRGNIFLLNARVILCFPFENVGDFRSYSSWDQFVALEVSSPLNLVPFGSSKKRYSSTTSCSLHLNVGDLDMYLITSASLENDGRNSCVMQRQTCFAQKILSVTDRTSCPSVLSMVWQEGAVTGPWIAKKAKLLATSEDSKGRNKFIGKDYEFASVTTVEDMEDINNLSRQEMILSSKFFLRVHLSPVSVTLCSSQYKALHHLLHEVMDGLSCVRSDPVGVTDEFSASQTSILVECDLLEISVSLEKPESTKGSMYNELPGSWNSLRVEVYKFELLSVSNIGGIRGADFLWVTHGEGNLWGSITEFPNEELLLISCSNSTMGRGDGEGSNILSSRCSGSDIVYLCDPESSHSYTSITVRCCTIVAIGGRLDWLDSIPSFFSMPSPEIEQAGDSSLKKEDSAKSIPCGSSFILSLVDIGLSYEPYLRNLVAGELFDSKSSPDNVYEEIGEKCVTCLLAASSLKLSNTTDADSIESDYKIRVQDLGLLLCPVSTAEIVGGTYSVEYLTRLGYVKVAREAHVEALLRFNCKNDLLWEVQCSGCHIFLDTCHDTTSGLIRLAAQLQRLFAPDIEESVVHLQTRWNNVQQAQESNETRFFDRNSIPSTSQVHTSSVDTESKPGAINLMDEIHDDAFHLDGNLDTQSDIHEAQLHRSLDDAVLKEASNLSTGDSESFLHNFSFTGAVPVIGLESKQTSFLQKSFPEFIEGYFLSELQHPLPELSPDNQSSHEILKCKSRNAGNRVVVRGNGWYGDSSFRIVDNHVSEINERTGQQRFIEGKTPTKCTRPEDYRKAKGRVLLGNINVVWRMYAGSDWCDLKKNVQHSGITCGRDKTACLELALSGIDFQCDIYPDGEICISRHSLTVQDIHLNDNSNDAPWKLVLGYYQSKDHPRESSSKAFKLDLEAVRPDPQTPLEEYRLRIAFLPMRLHLHQSQLDFLINFFGGKCSSVDQSPCPSQDSGESMMLRNNSNFGSHTITEEALLPYFQKFDIWPVLLRVDYNPCRVDLAALRGGKYVELVNLVPWKIRLQTVQAQTGQPNYLGSLGLAFEDLRGLNYNSNMFMLLVSMAGAVCVKQ
ncbi:autophagy-related protein 2 isoform X2 [Cornus florida]|uniref:autophagy-related protein 2 isoform X2 n=1 Tax=Cornus florida TaxID=4283 RepID=UPI00289FE6C5|nr:autophagy-related protein 2 isoform X2 [Cornus florida]